MEFKKQIYILTNTLLKGGAEKQCLLLAKALNKSFNVKIIILSGGLIDPNYATEIEKNQIQTIKLKGNIILNIFELFIIFRKNKSRFFVFSYLFKGNFLNSLCAIFFKNHIGIGGFRSSNIQALKLRTQRIFHNHFLNYTVCNSYKGRDYLKINKFNQNKIIVIPNTIELDDIPSKIFKKNNNEIKIISVGRLEKVKDYPTALKVISNLIILSELNDYTIKYIIVGYGSEKKSLMNEIEELGLKNNVSILDNVNPFDYLKEADIYLTTSIVEGLSNSILEALAFKLPIVATNVGDNEMLISHDVNGFLSKVGDHQSLILHLKKLILNKEIREMYGRQSFSLLNKNYNQEVFKMQYLNLIK